MGEEIVKNIFVTLVMGVAIFTFNFERVEGAEMTCTEIKMKMVELQMDAVTNCTKALNFPDVTARMEGTSCVLKCVLNNQGMLTPEGMINVKNIEERIQMRVPAAMKAMAKELVDICLATHAETVDPSEKLCKSYDPIIACLQDVVKQICP